ncbi:MAG: radical SAM protein, partial [Patescibacteria group bacterium]|nr:radical SAM protein [Patescibacteria group bacterium]
MNRECNFRCRWCYAKGTDYRTSRDMSLELAKSLAVMLKQIGIRELIVIGGEPAMWRPLIEFNEFCANEGFRSVLVTNGSRFGVDSFWRKYKQHPNDEIGLSLKAATRQQLQEVAGFSKYDVVRNGISRALSELGANASLTYNAFYVGNLVDIVRFAVDN